MSSLLDIPHNTGILAGSLLYVLEWAVGLCDLDARSEESGNDTYVEETAFGEIVKPGEGDEQAWGAPQDQRGE